MTNLQLDPPVEIFSRIELPGQLFTTVSIPEDSTLVLLNQQSLNLTMEVQEIHSSLVIGQGPAGAPGGEAMPSVYAERNDFVGEDIIYQGEAAPGSLPSDPVWRIRKVVFIGDDSFKYWADGDSLFDNVWDNRLSLDYS